VVTFIDDSGNTLNVDGEFSMTKQGVSIFNGFKIKGDYSTNFKVPNNSVTREVLNYYGPKMVSQVAWTKQAFNRTVEGNIIDRGFIVIQDDDGVNLDCYYTTGNSNWVNNFTGLITALDWSGYYETFTYATVISKLASTSGMVFPMVEWVQNLRRGYNIFRMDQYDPVKVYNVTGGQTITDQSYDPEKSLFDFYPCFYITTLVSELLQQNGIKLAGSLLTDPLYQSVVLSPSGGQMKREVFKNVIAYGTAQSVLSMATAKYVNFVETQDPENLFSSSRYTANKKAGLIFTTTIVSTTSGNSWDVILYKNGVEIDRWEQNAQAQVQSFKTYRADVNDYFEIYVQSAEIFTESIVLNLTIEIPEVIRVGDYINPVNFLPSWTGIDFLKAVFSNFGCELYYDEYSKTLTANIIERIKPESYRDWSKYYVSHKSQYTVDQAKKNYLRYADCPDAEISQFNKVNKTGYGNGLIQTTNELKQEVDLFKLPWMASGYDVDINGTYLSNSPLVSLKDTDSIAYSAISSIGGGQVQFTITATAIINTKEILRIVNSGGQDLGYFFVEQGATGSFQCYFPFTVSGSGFIYPQEISYLSSNPRILVNKPSIPFTSFASTLNGVKTWNTAAVVVDEDGTRHSVSSFSYGYFCKKVTGLTIDSVKENCAFTNPAANFIDPSLKDMNFNKIDAILKNPDIEFKFLLPEAEYQKYDFSYYVYVRAETFEGYILLYGIENYQDESTPVEVNAYMYG
jgi:hypothetical protein